MSSINTIYKNNNIKAMKRISINENYKQLFWKLGCGLVEYIEIYNEDGDKLYFRAGNGRFHMLRSELAEYQ